MAIEDKINNLDVSDRWKAKFLTIAKAKPISFGLIPKFENPKELNFSAKFNFLAFFFGVFYYAIKGMWKKALTFVGLAIILSIVVMIINPKFDQFVNLFIPVLAGWMANNDFYRFKVLDEGNFWW